MTATKAYGATALLVNAVMITGLAIQRMRGAPWLAIVITAGIALPVANVLMLLKLRRTQPIESR